MEAVSHKNLLRTYTLHRNALGYLGIKYIFFVLEVSHQGVSEFLKTLSASVNIMGRLEDRWSES